MSTIQQDEWFAAFKAYEAKLNAYRGLMALVAAGEPFDKQQLKEETEELDVLHKVFIDRGKPFTGL